ncbi:hypothetical protein VIGAN_08148700 [Vigna angularis var. angularis]|uniref:Uncharacterized protein n=1 Tax=Vigna angularis var. angularis TaxID=157739 RepID=A0A0S3SPW8_PHAAN|nr:hypothetical protein VIGAN_08148700 [Vigna angularis var. angularis]
MFGYSYISYCILCIQVKDKSILIFVFRNHSYAYISCTAVFKSLLLVSTENFHSHRHKVLYRSISKWIIYKSIKK